MKDNVLPQCGSHMATVDHLATKWDRMLGFGYMKLHIKIDVFISYYIKDIDLQKGIIYEPLNIRNNEKSEIRVDTRVSTHIKVSHNKPDIFVFDKKKKEILIVEIGITSQDRLPIVENTKLKKYDLFDNELGLLLKSRTRIVPYVMT